MVDCLRLEYNTNLDNIDGLVKKHDVLQDSYVIQFTTELDQMLKNSNNAYFGIEGRKKCLIFCQNFLVIYENKLISFRSFKKLYQHLHSTVEEQL